MKKEKNGLEIWWIGSFPQYLTWIYAVVSETDGRTDAGGLRHRSGSVDKSQGELKYEFIHYVVPNTPGPAFVLFHSITSRFVDISYLMITL